jgi:hypothetical protein
MSPVFEVVIAKAAKDPSLAAHIAGEFEFDANPYTLIPTSAVARAVLGRVLRGQFGLVPAFFKQGMHINAVQRELKARQRLLAELPASTRASAEAGEGVPAA